MRKLSTFFLLFLTAGCFAAEPILIGLATPFSGRYKEQGQAQVRGALLAVEEINNNGGIGGRPLKLLTENTASKPDHARQAVQALADQGAVFTFGGTSSDATLAAANQAAQNALIFVGVQGFANNLTEEDAQKYFFRETYSARMGAKALAQYLNTSLPGKKLFYMTADYQWGWSVEESLRRFTNTQDRAQHPGVKVQYPRPRHTHFQDALSQAEAAGADVLVMIQFGEDLGMALSMATRNNLKEKMTIVVPTLNLTMARDASAESIAGVISTLPWYWRIPEKYGFTTAQAFVNNFKNKYAAYPSNASSSAYSVVYQFRDAVQRASSLESDALISAMENHSYSHMKDTQSWRALDHQNTQSVYVVAGRDRNEVINSPLHSDYFDILMRLSAEESAISADEWKSVRQANGRPAEL